MAKRIRRIPSQGIARKEPPRGANIRKSTITGMYNVLRDSLIHSGFDERLARVSMESLRRIHNEYWSASTEVGHLLHQCRRKNCRQSNSRLGNARALRTRLSKVIDDFNALTDDTLQAVDYLVENSQEVIDAASHLEYVVQSGQEALFRATVVPSGIHEVRQLFDEYTSGYPYGFLSLVAKHASQMNEDMAGRFGDALYAKLVESASESFRTQLRDDYEKDGKQPNYIQFLRNGQMTSPDIGWIDELGTRLVNIARGGGRNMYWPFIEAVTAVDATVVEKVAQEPTGWPNLVAVFREDEIDDAVAFARRCGKHSSVLGELVARGVDRTQAIDCAKLLSETDDTSAAKLKRNVGKGHVSHALIRAAEIVPSLWSTPDDFSTLISGKESVKKVRAYADFLLQPGKREALLAFSRERPNKSIKGLLRQLSKYDDASIGEAVILCDSIGEALDYIRAEHETTDPYESIRDGASFAQLATYGSIGRLGNPDSVHRACTVLDQIYVPNLRNCLVRHTSILEKILDEDLDTGRVAELIERQEEFAHSPYSKLQQLYNGAEPVVEPLEISAQRIVFIGDYLRSAAIEAVAELLGVSYIHVPRGWSLDSLRQTISGGDCVAYHVKQCGHSHSGHVKWMTESVGGIWCELYATNEDRIRDRIVEKVAS